MYTQRRIGREKKMNRCEMDTLKHNNTNKNYLNNNKSVEDTKKNVI